MARAWSICSRCPAAVQGAGMCDDCRRESEARRRPDGNPYATRGHRAFREGVLARNPVCVLCHRRRSTVADHYPTERRDLVLAGMDPDDPVHGRGLCKTCHDKHTARTSPGGWNLRG